MKLALAVLAAVVIVALLLVLNVRAFVAAQREDVVARAARALGRPVHVDALTTSWWPLGLRMRGVRVDDDDEHRVPLATAEGVVVPIALASLVSGTVAPGGVRIERPVLHVVRDARRRWNVATLVRSSGRDAADEARSAGGRRAAVALPVEWVIGAAHVRVDDATIVVDDESGDQPRRLTIAALDAEGRDLRFGADAELTADAELHADGLIGRVHATVHVPNLGYNETMHTPFEATVVTRDIRLRPATSLVGLAVPVSGRIDELRAVTRGMATRFTTELDAHTSAASGHRGSRPVLPDAPIALRARVLIDGSQVAIEDTRLDVGALRMTLGGTGTTSPVHGTVDIDTVGDAGVDLAVAEPPVHVHAVHGHVLLEDGHASVNGALRVDDVPVDVAGTLRGVAPWVGELRLDAAAYGGTVRADTTADERVGSLHASLRGIDLGDALARWLPDAGDVDGTVAGDVALTAVGAGGALRDAAVTGSGEITVTDGRVRGTNLAARVLDGVTGGAVLQRLLSARVRSRYEQALGGGITTFRRAHLPFTIADGRVIVDDARLNAEAFDVTGSGWLRVAAPNREVRFHGDLALTAPLSAAITEDVGALRLLRGADGRVTVPFRVRGALTDAHAEADPKRLRDRGVDALLAEPGGGRPDAGSGGATPGRRSRHEGVARELLERAQRMLRP